MSFKMTGSSLKVRIDQKLEEAEFFLEELRKLENTDTSTINEDQKVYQYYASAFLNAARSPQQYILEAMKQTDRRDRKGKKKYTPDLCKDWYENAVKNADPLPFIADERNLNIHESITTPISNIVITFGAALAQSKIFTGEWRDYSGSDKRVVSIAQAALVEIRKLVEDGFFKGHIT
jgi:hypothetical protein